jgi:glycosyltransferase involved in cell wall biosynthesis
MALGKAVLVSKVPPVYDYVVDGKTALYYMPYNSEDLFKKILFLLNDEELVAKLGKEARRVVERYFNLENMGKRLWNCVSTLLKNIK